MRTLVENGTVASDVWCDLIVRRCGLTFRDTQIATLVGLVRERMQACGAVSEGAYYTKLTEGRDSSPEWAALVERLLNHETSFFRHPPSFDFLRTQVLPELREARAGASRLNLWSAGCSTGQEAYSLAMLAMTDTQLRGEFTVWGGDISQQAIEVARRGRYGPRAIAGIPSEHRQRFVRTVTDGGAPEYEIAEELRRRVRFTTINLLTGSGVSLNHDVIFCHNVLIYFPPAVASQVVTLLADRLTLNGYLFLGPGEGPSERPPGLDLVPANGVRVFRRRGRRPVEARS